MNEFIFDENGSIRLPCKPGDYVYKIDRRNKKINAHKVKTINIYMSKKHFSMQIEFETAGFCFHREFGKSVFLNKADAQHALKEYLSRENT